MIDKRLSLDEVFSAYELRRTELRSTTTESSAAATAFDNLIEALRHAMQVFGRGDAKKWKPHERGGKPSPYAELLERLLPKGTSSVPSHALVTFNYDVCLDRCLINLRDSPADYDLDYGIQFSNARCLKAPPFETPRPERSILALRTHGSLNWRRCRACHSVFTTLSKQTAIPDDFKCYACGRQRMDYVLVHPSFNRRYDDPLLQIVWGRMFEEFVKSDRWVLIGYSLPSADFHFRELLRDSLTARDSKGMATEVVLVGRKDDAFTRLVESYRWLFENHLKVWRPTTGGFADFVKTLS
jgi:hypothetical protein